MRVNRQQRCLVGRAALLLLGAGVCAAAVAVAATYQEPEAFLAESFAGEVPPARKLWITADLKNRIRGILQRDLGVARLRYWRRDDRTAWILEEIGKEKPITTGIVVAHGHIERIQVLVFRESRGWEVRYPFFTDQFQGAGVTADHELDRSIDGISGATLSVQALTRLARLAVVLHEHAENASLIGQR